MGSCVSSHKDASRDAAVKVKLASFGYKTENKPTVADVVLKLHSSPSRSVSSFPDFGSKEETFFDSQPWLESDCDDDFYSVNGDFTPSRGSTPVHHSFSKGAFPNGHISSPMPKRSPVGKKKKLAELFKESTRGEKDVGDQNAPEKENLVNDSRATHNRSPKSADNTSYVSGTNSVCSRERRANGDCITERSKPIESVQCCLPGFVSCRSYSERRKLSPAVAVNGTSLPA